jgi:hypothetical protein
LYTLYVIIKFMCNVCNDLLDLRRLQSPSFDEVSPQVFVSHKPSDIHGAVEPGVALECVYKRQCWPATSSNPLSRFPEK